MRKHAKGEAGRSGLPFLPKGRRALAGLCCGVLAVVGVGIAAGQSGGGQGTPARASAPACARAGAMVDRPSAVPAEVLPPGTVLTSVAHPLSGTTFVTGVVPRDLRSAVDFYVTDFARAGYRNGRGDAEQGEAESFFSGRGIGGKWKLNGIMSCPRAVTIALAVRS